VVATALSGVHSATGRAQAGQHGQRVALSCRTLDVGPCSGARGWGTACSRHEPPPSSRPSAPHPTSASPRLLSVVRRSRSWFSRLKCPYVNQGSGRIRPVERADEAIRSWCGIVGRDAAAPTPCMPCSFGPLHSPRSAPGDQLSDPRGVTVAVRWLPLVPAAYGTRVAQPARTTMLRPGGDGSQLDRRVRPVLGTPLLVGKSPEGLAAAGWGDSNSTSPVSPVRGQGAVGPATCGSDERLVTAPARRCPRFAVRLRTQHGPTGSPRQARPPGAAAMGVDMSGGEPH
jgi:hypothetical protein